MPTEKSIRSLGEWWPRFIYTEIILAWEVGLKDADFADLRSAHIREMESSMNFERRAFETAEACDTFLKEHTNELPDAYLYFSSEKKAQTGMIFQHFRNAFAHAHFEFDGDWFELFTVTNKNKLKMKARLRSHYFAELVHFLRKGARAKSGELL